MVEFRGTLDLRNLLKNKSFFLFGPRSTGKSTLVRNQLGSATIIDLLHPKVFRDYVRHPELLGEIEHQNLIIIDEIQKIPSLLDEVHRSIELKKITFLLTGSSARKLKRGGSNLLAGRAWWAQLFPLTSLEIPNFDLVTYLNRGGLPMVYPNPNFREELIHYTGLYLKEEIMAEALVRNIAQFSEFLELMALSNGHEINYQSLGNDCGVSPNSIKNYIQVLEDTLVAFPLKAFSKTKKRKAISRSKIYFFDVGVTNQLSKRGEIIQGSEVFGQAFEHFILQEVRAYISYARKDTQMMYWRSESQHEVDLILSNQWAFEIKSTSFVQPKHCRGLKAIHEEQMIQHLGVISLDNERRTIENHIHVYPWKEFLHELWAGKLI